MGCLLVSLHVVARKALLVWLCQFCPEHAPSCFYGPVFVCLATSPLLAADARSLLTGKVARSCAAGMPCAGNLGISCLVGGAAWLNL